MPLILQLLDSSAQLIRKSKDFRIDVRNSEGTVLKGNCIGALCLICNINVTEKQNILPCFAHFSGRYDLKFVLEGITNQETFIISKPGDNFVSVKVKERQMSIKSSH